MEQERRMKRKNMSVEDQQAVCERELYKDWFKAREKYWNEWKKEFQVLDDVKMEDKMDDFIKWCKISPRNFNATGITIENWLALEENENILDWGRRRRAWKNERQKWKCTNSMLLLNWSLYDEYEIKHASCDNLEKSNSIQNLF